MGFSDPWWDRAMGGRGGGVGGHGRRGYRCKEGLFGPHGLEPLARTTIDVQEETHV